MEHANIKSYKAEKVNDFVWEIPKTEKNGMNVPARIYASEKLFKEMDSGVFEQITNVACMPGIKRYALAFPDAHWGYGSCVGGTAAFDLREGVISPGMIGFDICCGMRIIKTNLHEKDVRPKIKEIVNALYRNVPVGVGGKSRFKLTRSEFQDLMTNGVKWCEEKGYGWGKDHLAVEEHGKISGADHSKVSQKAVERGLNQLGTLGSGNHYLEVQVVPKGGIADEKTAKALGIVEECQVVIMLHCGSRGFGHQVATDYLEVFEKAMPKYGIKVNDRQLACAPYESAEGRDYYAAMACAANNAFSNRQVIAHQIRESFREVFKTDPEKLGMEIIYDVCHNIAKIEKHFTGEKTEKVIVHRKGATRSFEPGHEELWGVYSKVGQPVIVGGSMETGSYLCVGTKKAMQETFGSTMHGSGRTMSRQKAKKMVKGETLQKEMEKRGIFVKAASYAGLAEEAGLAYKDISEVVNTMHNAGISLKVTALKPIGNIKG
ncbi:MAG: RtcB family protein [Candidatus Diapherotrites archaeon]|nr:RtcB family protein [Candidatus Diapherotrites archaeon]